MNRKVVVEIILLGSALFLLSACQPANDLPAASNSVLGTATPVHGSTLDGKTLLEERCNVCHPLSYVYQSRGTPEQWKGVVSTMKANGAVLSPQEEQILDDYLAKNFGQ